MSITVDKKGIVMFLAISIGISWAVEGFLALHPLSVIPGSLQASCILIAVLMTPAFTGLITSIVRGDTRNPELTLWPVPKYPAIGLALLVLVLFVVVYAVTTLAGWSVPDWKMKSLHTEQYSVDPSFFVVSGFLLTLIAGPTVFALVCAAFEFGWRAYLLPTAAPLGRLWAHLLIGVSTGIWALPLVCDPFRDPRTALSQAPHLILICIAVSAFLNELWLRRRHTGLTAVCAGSFLSQATGMWQYLYPDIHSPYAGAMGAVSIVVWLCAALALSRAPLPSIEAETGVEPDTSEADSNRAD